MLYIVKIGGNVVDNELALQAFIADLSSLKAPFVLVHGGGKVATQVSKALGIETQMVEGRRITDLETLKVVTMVYAGLVNKTIVAALQAKGCNAVGLSGADANLIRSHKRISNGVDYGFVGDVDDVNALFISNLVEKGHVPVVAPITHDGSGQLLNTNADTIAQSIAVAMSKHTQVSLVYCFELPGVMRDVQHPDSVIHHIDEQQYLSLKNEGVIHSGMIPKMDNCFQAIKSGVSEVRICQATDLLSIVNTNATKGTCLVA